MNSIKWMAAAVALAALVAFAGNLHHSRALTVGRDRARIYVYNTFTGHITETCENGDCQRLDRSDAEIAASNAAFIAAEPPVPGAIPLKDAIGR